MEDRLIDTSQQDLPRIFFFFFLDFIYLFMKEKEAETQAEGKAPRGEPDMGLHPRTLGS